jgi:hypothetical protein
MKLTPINYSRIFPFRISSLARYILALSLFLSCFVYSTPGGAETTTPATPKTNNPISLLMHFQYGLPAQYVSEILYSNFEMASLGIALEKECGLWPFWGNRKLVESILLEFRFSKIWGRGIELTQDQVSKEVWEQAQKEGHRPRTDWDHFQIGLTPYYRLYYPLAKQVRVYAEAGIGFTLLNKPLIEDGTTWNFLLTGGLGLDWKLYNCPFYVFLRSEHFSNGGKLWKEGVTNSRVIGPETLAFGIGIRYPMDW